MEFGDFSSASPSAMPESNASLAEVVGGHFHVHAVTDADANEVLAHLAGNMGEDLVTVGERDAKHRPGQHLRYRTSDFDWFFFSQDATTCVSAIIRALCATVAPETLIMTADNAICSGGNQAFLG